MMKKVKVGIIGAGRIGQLHADNLLRSNIYKIKTFADICTDHLIGTHYEKEIPVITNEVNKVFQDKDIDAVFICSSTDTHVEYIKAAAKAGKHIFCEKPISLDLLQTKEALACVEEHGVHLQVGFNRRFDKHFRKVQHLVREGKVGDVHLVKISSRDPQVPPEDYIKVSGGMFIDMTIHDFDMVRYLVGAEVRDVTVKANCLIDPVFEKYEDVDTAVITLTFENDVIAVIDNSRQAVYGYDQRIEVFGSEGSVAADNETETNVKVSTRDHVISDNPKSFFLERYIDSYKVETEEFAAAILQQEKVPCTGVDGYQAEKLALAARISWKENRTVEMSELQGVKVLF